MIEIICSGIGGQGVLVAGMVLADVAMEDGKNVSWYPSYGFEMRGGAANCEVKIGDEDLQSPYCYEPDILLTMSESAIDTFEERLKPGGVLLVNSSLVNPDRKYRDDIKVIKVPATDIANELNNHRGTNIIMLGALAGFLIGEIGPLGLAISLGFASGAMLYVVFGEILPQAILMYHSKLPAFSAIAGILVGILIIFG